MYKRIIFLMIISLQVGAETLSTSDQDAFVWQFQRFIESLQIQDFAQLSAYETETTICGFGPGEEGKGCIKKALELNQGCLEDMLLSLKQGCKVKSYGDTLSCISPPQWADETIIILGARSQFDYQAESRSITVKSFICGGD